jgi:hypothetical protein
MWCVNVGLLGIGVGYVCMERGVNVVNGIDVIDGHRVELLFWFPVLLAREWRGVAQDGGYSPSEQQWSAAPVLSSGRRRF